MGRNFKRHADARNAVWGVHHLDRYQNTINPGFSFNLIGENAGQGLNQQKDQGE